MRTCLLCIALANPFTHMLQKSYKGNGCPSGSKVTLKGVGKLDRYLTTAHDDVIKWKHFPRYWPFVRGIHRWPGNSPHKGQWRGALLFSLICAWIKGWVNSRDADDLRRHRVHYDVIVMWNRGGDVIVTIANVLAVNLCQAIDISVGVTRPQWVKSMRVIVGMLSIQYILLSFYVNSRLKAALANS